MRFLFVITAFFLLTGCSTVLERSQISEAQVTREEMHQKILAHELEIKRERRLREVVSKLQPAINRLCNGMSLLADNCSFPIELVNDDTLNASADGKSVRVHAGMVRFVESETEIAFIVGHEMAHNMLSHMDKKTANMLIGSFFDVLAAGYGIDTKGGFGKIGAQAFSQNFEAEADYLSLYIIALAGYDITEAPTFWRRMGIEHPDSISKSFNSTHPSSPERFVAMDVTVNEILNKRNNGMPLIPNTKYENHAKVDKNDTPDIDVNALTESNPPASINRNTIIHYGYEDGFNSSRTSQRFSDAKYRTKNNDKIFGEWQYVAEQVAMDYGCIGENGARPTTTLDEKDIVTEEYTADCRDQVQLTIVCRYTQCSITQLAVH